MASSGIQFALVLVMTVAAAVMFDGATAQSGCTSALMSLSPCLNYVSGNTSTPSKSCCSQLSGVVSSQPQCLCQLVNGGGSSLGITINQTRALGLPSDCKVNTPSASRCGGGSNVPSNSPGSSSNGSPKTPATGSSTPSTPSDDGDAPTIGTSDASITAGMQLYGKLFLLLVAYCTSSFVGL